VVLGLRWAPIVSTFTHLHFYAVFAAVCVTDTADGVLWLVCLCVYLGVEEVGSEEMMSLVQEVCVCVCTFRCGGGGQ